MRSVQSANMAERALLAEPADAADHVAARLPGLDAPLPGFSRRIEVAQRLWNFARRLVAELMARPAAIRLDHVPATRAWLFMFGEMPLPCGPVPGNSLLSGTFSSEYQ